MHWLSGVPIFISDHVVMGISRPHIGLGWCGTHAYPRGNQGNHGVRGLRIRSDVFARDVVSVMLG